jgi:pimeloyl-ACP methyl ester carboxylesterase
MVNEAISASNFTIPRTSTHRVEADGVSVFYREAGPADGPVVLLLHGFPTSSFQYRELMPRLADSYRVIAPDLPGFGFTEVPEQRHYRYTFDSLAHTMLAFTEVLGLKRYVLYVFDYGAPTGFRLALAHPERVTAIISQNGNAYEEGLGDAWAPIRRYWSDPSLENREVLRKALTPEGIRREYSSGISNPDLIAPEGWTLDAALIARPGNADIQLDLFLDYANNVKLYPGFQDYFRKVKPPILAIWGRHDPYFLPAGAEAFRRDNPNSVVQLLDTGHFALETHVQEVALAMRRFLEQASTVATKPKPLSPGKLGARIALIGVVLATIAGLFAYAGGWFTPKSLTPAEFIAAFEQVDGVHPGFRRNHARGMCVSGFFESNGNGARFSKAGVFKQGRIPVIGRFSLSGGQPDAADKPNEVRGMAIQFPLPDGELWRTAMVNLPVFPFRTPEAFYENLVASKPDPQTGKPDPAKSKEFIDRHPETAEAMKIIKQHPRSSGFGNSTFHGLHAFLFTNSSGDSTPVRWMFVPVQPFAAVNANAIPQNKDYLFDELSGQIHGQPLQWHLILTIGLRGDPTNDATIPWPDDREKVDVGTLTLDRVDSDEKSEATGINFDPLVLPAGIAPSDDPLLSARSAIYSRGFTKRSGETKQPSATTDSAERKGG